MSELRRDHTYQLVVVRTRTATQNESWAQFSDPPVSLRESEQNYLSFVDQLNDSFRSAVV